MVNGTTVGTKIIFNGVIITARVIADTPATKVLIIIVDATVLSFIPIMEIRTVPVIVMTNVLPAITTRATATEAATAV